MGACQNEFQNVPDATSEEIEELKKQIQERNRETEIIRSGAIKQQHKTLRPNSKTVSIGMIDRDRGKSLYLSQVGTYDFYNQDNEGPMGARSTVEPMALFSKRELDGEQLHQTKRPYSNNQEVQIGDDDEIVSEVYHEGKQLSNLDFFYSLGLPEYAYQPIPQPYRKQYEDLQLYEQQERHGVYYMGERKNEKIHGNGVLKSNTMKYIGQFRDGVKWFHGREIELEEVYEGQFQNGRRKGQGVRYTLTSVEEGEFDEHLIVGKITYHNGDVYQGKLRNKKFHDTNGKLRLNDKGVTYSGNFKKGKLQGKGKIEFDDGRRYQGDFHEGLKHGKGLFEWDSMNSYEGQYKQGKKNGKGILIRNGAKFQGQFQDGLIVNLKKKREHGDQASDRESSISDGDGIPEHWKGVISTNSAN